MANKLQERIYVEKAKELLGWNCTINDIPEPIDFELQDRNAVWGIEVRHILKNERESKGSSDKEAESRTSHGLMRLADDYYKNGGGPIQFKIRGSIRSEPIRKQILDALSSRQHGTALSHEVVQISSNVTLHITNLPESQKHYRHWQSIDHRVGWVRPVTSAELQHAIDEKAKKLSAYKDKYERIDLLLVADRIFDSGRLSLPADTQIKNPGFTNIYFLSYPDAIQALT